MGSGKLGKLGPPGPRSMLHLFLSLFPTLTPKPRASLAGVGSQNEVEELQPRQVMLQGLV